MMSGASVPRSPPVQLSPEEEGFVPSVNPVENVHAHASSSRPHVAPPTPISDLTLSQLWQQNKNLVLLFFASTIFFFLFFASSRPSSSTSLEFQEYRDWKRQQSDRLAEQERDENLRDLMEMEEGRKRTLREHTGEPNSFPDRDGAHYSKKLKELMEYKHNKKAIEKAEKKKRKKKFRKRNKHSHDHDDDDDHDHDHSHRDASEHELDKIKRMIDQEDHDARLLHAAKSAAAAARDDAGFVQIHFPPEEGGGNAEHPAAFLDPTSTQVTHDLLAARETQAEKDFALRRHSKPSVEEIEHDLIQFHPRGVIDLMSQRQEIEAEYRDQHEAAERAQQLLQDELHLVPGGATPFGFDEVPVTHKAGEALDALGLVRPNDAAMNDQRLMDVSQLWDTEAYPPAPEVAPAPPAAPQATKQPRKSIVRDELDSPELPGPAQTVAPAPVAPPANPQIQLKSAPIASNQALKQQPAVAPLPASTVELPPSPTPSVDPNSEVDASVTRPSPKSPPPTDPASEPVSAPPTPPAAPKKSAEEHAKIKSTFSKRFEALKEQQKVVKAAAAEAATKKAPQEAPVPKLGQ